MAKLEITNEIYHSNKFYYTDSNKMWYKIAIGVTVPCSPLVSYTKYNDTSLYTLIEDEELIVKLDSELEQILEDGKKKTTDS